MMGAEDFSRYGMTDERIPLCMFWVGATAASVVREAEKSGQAVPSLHSPFFYADAPVALPVGTSAMSAAVIELMRK
jgi:hippurate hydrolase